MVLCKTSSGETVLWSVAKRRRYKMGAQFILSAVILSLSILHGVTEPETGILSLTSRMFTRFKKRLDPRLQLNKANDVVKSQFDWDCFPNICVAQLFLSPL